MEIYFLGAGEACDPTQQNTSILLKTSLHERHGRILLDCGFSVPLSYFSLDPLPEELEVLWISHFHGDHFLGAPLLLLWFWEAGRQKPLHIAGPPGVAAKIEQAVELAYPNLLPRLGFSLQFHEIAPGTKIKICDAVFQAAYNDHSLPCLSLRFNIYGNAIFYSGDGRPTPMTQALAAGCDIIIHEAYGFEDTTPGHGSIANCLDFADNAGVRLIALVHLQRNVRAQSPETIHNLAKRYPEIKIFLPEKETKIVLQAYTEK
ncbi:MAG: MBL fold metallo-hydrolase [Desulfobulbales bacterium]|nr:MBL fold metallo-hydrolase [Desulfobulbales bacterium]